MTLEFPISKETFKKSFLGGDGSFEVTTATTTRPSSSTT